jgi:hypothetical protein
MGSVVHCQVAAYDVYVGRGCDPADGGKSCWGNPFRIGRDGRRAEVIEKHRRWLWVSICSGDVSVEELAGLAGQVLGCWCAPKSCHGETLVRASEWACKVVAGKIAFDRESDEPPF